MTDDKNSQIQNVSFEIGYSHRTIVRVFSIAATKEKKQAIW